MTYELITALVAFAFISSITPGPNNLMLLASGTNFGFERTVPHLMGVSAGFTFLIILTGLGLMQVFILFPVVGTVFKIASASYLTYLAWKIATSVPTKQSQESSRARPMTFFEGVMFQWINPKAWVMGLTAISAYAPPSPSIWSIAIVAIVFGTIMVPSITMWALLGTQIQRFLNDPFKLRIFNIAAALLLIGSMIPVFLMK